jgi:hypothetical protein
MNSSNNINNTIVKLVLVKSIVFSLVLIGISMGLQEVLTFEEKKKTVHSSDCYWDNQVFSISHL